MHGRWNRRGGYDPDEKNGRASVDEVVDVSQGGWQEPNLWEISKLQGSPGLLSYKLREDNPNPGRQGGATTPVPAGVWVVITDITVSGFGVAAGSEQFRLRISSHNTDGKNVKRYERESDPFEEGQGTRWSEATRLYFRPDQDIKVEIKDLAHSETMINLTLFWAPPGVRLPH